MHLAILLLLITGCDDTLFNAADTDLVSTGEGGFCAVRDTMAARCTGCHGASGPSAGLDLATDPHAAVVDVPSTQFGGAVLVVPGDAAGSLLYRKVSATHSAEEGSSMPPGGGLDDASAGLVEAWIADGATEACDEPADTGLTGRYHPAGWAEPADHGHAAKHQTEQCTACHGDDLTGGSTGVSCDACHQAGWRSTCTFCHGGTDNLTGAPPRDIDGSDTRLSFAPHTAHVEADLSTPWDCTECHRKPTDVLSPGHLFVGDSTPGRAEVDLSGGLSPAGTWSSGSCGGTYCHGNGRGNNGTVSAAAGPVGCDSCHPDVGSGRVAWEAMSGEHEDHLREGVTCRECHGLTTADDRSIADPTVHVDGTKTIALRTGITWSGATCTGTCHAEPHEAERWN